METVIRWVRLEETLKPIHSNPCRGLAGCPPPAQAAQVPSHLALGTSRDGARRLYAAVCQYLSKGKLVSRKILSVQLHLITYILEDPKGLPTSGGAAGCSPHQVFQHS